MSTESIKENVIRKVLQELIVPELKDTKNEIGVLKERIRSTNTRIDELDKRMNVRFDFMSERIDALN